MIDNKIEAFKKMEYYCTYSERCKSEVVEKMKQMGIPHKFYDEILTHLKTGDFLNEERFAKEYVIGKFSVKKWGRIKISQQLFAKGIDEKIVCQALKEIDFKRYLDTLKTLVVEKMRGTTLYNLHDSKKCMNAMMRKGYEYDLVLQTFLELKNEKA